MLELAADRSMEWESRRGLFRYDDMLADAVSPSRAEVRVSTYIASLLVLCWGIRKLCAALSRHPSCDSWRFEMERNASNRREARKNRLLRHARGEGPVSTKGAAGVCASPSFELRCRSSKADAVTDGCFSFLDFPAD